MKTRISYRKETFNLLHIVLIFNIINYIHAQTIIGGIAIDPSAILEAKSINKGFLPPRLSTAQRDSIVLPAGGLLIYNTTLHRIQINQGSAASPDWRSLGEFPPSGNQAGEILFWNGTNWVLLNPGLPGQIFALSLEGIPQWTGNALPTLSTTLPSNTSPVSVQIGGQITSDGGAAVSSRGVVYGTTQNPTLLNGIQTSESGTGSFTVTLQGLIPGITYYARAFATNSTGTAYGNSQSFTTLAASVPLLTTNSIASITTTGAITGGQVSSNEGASVTQRGVVFSTNPNPTLSDNFTQNGSGTGNFSSTLSGLTPNTIYYVRAYAVNAVGTAYGQQASFITQLPLAPSLTTRDIINITNATATSGGDISNDGGLNVTARGIVWSTSTSPTLSDFKTTDGTGTGTYPSFLTGLSPGSTYFVRAYATNSIGTGYGNQLSFTTALTSNTLPVVQTLSVDGILIQEVTVSAEVVNQGGDPVIERGIVWNTNGNPRVIDNRISVGNGTGSFQAVVSGLSGGSRFYTRAYAVNGFGIAYGEEIEFITAFGVPVVSTNNDINIFLNTIQGGGTVEDAGGYPVTARGLVYDTSPNPVVSGNKTVEGDGLGAFNSTITGLTPNTTYYLRAYATNSSGTGYGNDIAITTNSPTPDMTDIDGNAYPTVQIGTQIWTSSNLKTTRYRNGDLIPLALSDMAWTSGASGKWSYYNHDDANNAVFGKLYNSHVVSDSRGLCPSGWHAPNFFELLSFINYLGGIEIAGGKLKNTGTTYWNTPNTGATNTSGFNGVPGGYRSSMDGSFQQLGNLGLHWGRDSSVFTLSTYSDDFHLNTISLPSGLGNPGQNPNNGFSVRCLANTPPTLTTAYLTATYSPNTNTNPTLIAVATSVNDGGEPITVKGFVYSNQPNPTIADNTTAAGVASGSFNSQITGMVSGTTYYIRAFATNSIGTEYGNEFTIDYKTVLDTCGAFISPGVWKRFMCHNLGAVNPYADPFTPSWEINGAYWQWGRKHPAAPGPGGPGIADANDGAIVDWSQKPAINFSWSDNSKTANDPCPPGYRIPIDNQLDGLILNNSQTDIGTWNSSPTNYSSGKFFGNKLFLPSAGYREAFGLGGNLARRGNVGRYWNSRFFGYLEISNGSVIRPHYLDPLHGLSIRCIAE